LHAAHAALMCLVTCKIEKQPECVQLAILKRYLESTWVIRLAVPSHRQSLEVAILS
jgi:hypothetical protein